MIPTDTATDDIHQFMDCSAVEKAILAGHSLAGVELNHFAATFPNRVDKLIYLDDRRAEMTIMEQNPLRNMKLERKENFPRTVEEYVADMKRHSPRQAEISSELWDEDFVYNEMRKFMPE